MVLGISSNYDKEIITDSITIPYNGHEDELLCFRRTDDRSRWLSNWIIKMTIPLTHLIISDVLSSSAVSWSDWNISIFVHIFSVVGNARLFTRTRSIASTEVSVRPEGKITPQMAARTHPAALIVRNITDATKQGLTPNTRLLVLLVSFGHAYIIERERLDNIFMPSRTEKLPSLQQSYPEYDYVPTSKPLSYLRNSLPPLPRHYYPLTPHANTRYSRRRKGQRGRHF